MKIIAIKCSRYKFLHVSYMCVHVEHWWSVRSVSFVSCCYDGHTIPSCVWLVDVMSRPLCGWPCSLICSYVCTVDCESIICCSKVWFSVRYLPVGSPSISCWYSQTFVLWGLHSSVLLWCFSSYSRVVQQSSKKFCSNNSPKIPVWSLVFSWIDCSGSGDGSNSSSSQSGCSFVIVRQVVERQQIVGSAASAGTLNQACSHGYLSVYNMCSNVSSCPKENVSFASQKFHCPQKLWLSVCQLL